MLVERYLKAKWFGIDVANILPVTTAVQTRATLDVNCNQTIPPSASRAAASCWAAR